MLTGRRRICLSHRSQRLLLHFCRFLNLLLGCVLDSFHLGLLGLKVFVCCCRRLLCAAGDHLPLCCQLSFLLRIVSMLGLFQILLCSRAALFSFLCFFGSHLQIFLFSFLDGHQLLLVQSLLLGKEARPEV